MTMPYERKSAVNRTRELLTDILNDKYDVSRELWDEVRACLKHYPGSYDMEQASESSPDIFGEYDQEGISRFEYITENGREIVDYSDHYFQIQDEGRTLKVFKK